MFCSDFSIVFDCKSVVITLKNMASTTQTTAYTAEQIRIWLRGLLTVAWADGQFDESEKSMIQSMVESEFAPGTRFDDLTSRTGRFGLKRCGGAELFADGGDGGTGQWAFIHRPRTTG